MRIALLGCGALLFATACKEKCEPWSELPLEEISICNDRSVEGKFVGDFSNVLVVHGWTQLYNPDEKIDRLADHTFWESVGHGLVQVTHGNFGVVYVTKEEYPRDLVSAKDAAPALKLEENSGARVKALRTALKAADAKLGKAPSRVADAALDAIDPDKTQRTQLVVIEASALDAPTDGVHDIVLWFPKRLDKKTDTLRTRGVAARALERLSTSRLALVASEVTHTEQGTKSSGLDGVYLITQPHLVKAKLALVDLQTGDVLGSTLLVSERARTGKSDDMATYGLWRDQIAADFQAAVQKMNPGLRVATR